MGIIGGYVRELRGISASSSPVFLQRSPSRYVVGLDLAQAADYTALCAIEHKVGVLDPNSELERHCGISTYPQVKAEYLDVRFLQRWRGMSYVAIIERVKELLATAPLCGDGNKVRPATLVVDASGVGKGVCDLITTSGQPFIGVTITSGSGATHDKANYWNVSKLLLVSILDAALHSGKLRIAGALAEAPALAEELKDFRRAVTAAGHATFAARANQHDDLVLATALCTWWASRPKGSQAGMAYW